MIICTVNDTYDPINGQPGMIIFIMMPLASIGMPMVYIKESEPLIEDNFITKSGGVMSIYTCGGIIAAIYWIYYIKETKAEKQESR